MQADSVRGSGGGVGGGGGAEGGPIKAWGILPIAQGPITRDMGLWPIASHKPTPLDHRTLHPHIRTTPCPHIPHALTPRTFTPSHPHTPTP